MNQTDTIGNVTIRLRFLPWSGNATEAQRLRSALKVLLRSYGIRNEGITPDIPSKLPPVSPELDPCKTEPPFAASENFSEPPTFVAPVVAGRAQTQSDNSTPVKPGRTRQKRRQGP